MTTKKFKIWHKQKKYWLSIENAKPYNGQLGFNLEVIEIIQSTGRNDRLGEEIYEKDLVKVWATDVNGHKHEIIGMVDFEDFEFVVVSRWGNSKWPVISFGAIDECERIGSSLDYFCK